MASILQESTRQKSIERAREKCRKKFLYYFPKGFRDQTYKDWERDYKWNAHQEWNKQLHKEVFQELLAANDYLEIANRAVKLETRTNLLFSFEKMALRDAVKTTQAAKSFAEGLYTYVYGNGSLEQRFENFVRTVSALPRKQTRVLTWPLVTVFGFIGNPQEFIFLKPKVTRIAAEKYAFDIRYQSKPDWNTYASLLEFAGQIKADLADWKPRDLIDIQSFIWVMGSDEYP